MTRRCLPSLSCRLIVGVLALCLLMAGAAAGDRPQTGLMWLRSPLPAVFPLQVRTAPGHNYLLTLIEEETGEQRLAAFIEGGRFFRVLVPPGSYYLQFAYGARWQDEEALFGPGTRIYEMENPLTFETKGVDRKGGHMVDLRDLIETREAALVRPIGTCQRLRIDYVAVPKRWQHPTDDAAEELPPIKLPRFVVTPRICG